MNKILKNVYFFSINVFINLWVSKLNNLANKIKKQIRYFIG